MEAGTSDEESSGISRRLEEALEHPLRALIFAELTKQSLGQAELAEVLGTSFAGASYHYGVLERVGGVQAAGETRGREEP